jgi:hypothetical protein
MVGGSHQLELCLNRAGTGHGDEFAPADLEVQHRHNGLLAQRAFQNIGGFGKSFAPIHAHRVRSISGEG